RDDLVTGVQTCALPICTVTAGNAPPVNDGASAVVVMSAARARELGVTPIARIVGQATSGLAPRLVLMTPVEAVRKLTTKIGWSSSEERRVGKEAQVGAR